MWYDRQWNCGGVVVEKEWAWDWFAIQFDGIDTDLMFYRLYQLDGKREIYGGTYTKKNGESVFLGEDDLTIQEVKHWESNRSKATYPVQWKVTVPNEAIEATITAQQKDQELELSMPFFTKMYYWEGMSSVEGTINGEPVTGKSYVEMTNRNKVKP
jgi:predicted secreted hydrolase